MKIKLLLFVFALSIFSINVQARNKYKTLEFKEGVTFYYKWQRQKIFKKDSPLKLVIKIKNDNNSLVKVAYTVDYYWQTIRKASSEEQIFCVRSRESILGTVQKSGFDAASFTNNQLLSDDFIVEISNVSVELVEKCIIVTSKDKEKDKPAVEKEVETESKVE